MPWLHILAAAVTPADSIGGSLTSYILNYGVLGVGVVLLVLRIIVPGKAVTEARDAARADLLKENERLLAEKRQAEEARDEALRVGRDEVIPVLREFAATTHALIPLLQELVRRGGPS